LFHKEVNPHQVDAVVMNSINQFLVEVGDGKCWHEGDNKPTNTKENVHMKKHFDFNKPAIRCCAVVAILLNSDGYRKKDKSAFSASDVWNSNSHGELFGVLGAIRIADEFLNKMYDKLPPEMSKAIIKALNLGEEQSVDETWYTGGELI
jgi:hypothetical protein